MFRVIFLIAIVTVTLLFGTTELQADEAYKAINYSAGYQSVQQQRKEINKIAACIDKYPQIPIL